MNNNARYYYYFVLCVRDDRSYSLPLGGAGQAYSSGRNSSGSNVSSLAHDPSPSPHMDSNVCEYPAYAFCIFIMFFYDYSTCFSSSIFYVVLFSSPFYSYRRWSTHTHTYTE